MALLPALLLLQCLYPSCLSPCWKICKQSVLVVLLVSQVGVSSVNCEGVNRSRRQLSQVVDVATSRLDAVISSKTDSIMSKINQLIENMNRITVDVSAASRKLESVEKQLQRTVTDNRMLYMENGRLVSEVQHFEQEKITREQHIANLTTRIARLTYTLGHCTTPQPQWNPAPDTTRGRSGEWPLRDCADYYHLGNREDGVYPVVSASGSGTVDVMCDMTSNEGGWTVLLRRHDDLVHQDFFQLWEQYRRGFGDASGEHWLGLEKLHFLTRDCPHQLRVELARREIMDNWSAIFDTFTVDDERSKYRVHIPSFNRSDHMAFILHESMDGQRFSTADSDNEGVFYQNCARDLADFGGWWYNNPDCGNVFLISRHPHLAVWGNDHGKRTEFDLSQAILSVRPATFPVPCPRPR